MTEPRSHRSAFRTIVLAGLGLLVLGVATVPWLMTGAIVLADRGFNFGRLFEAAGYIFLGAVPLLICGGWRLFSRRRR
jgi:hypothetical protein